MNFLSPLASLVALAVVLPLTAYALLELRSRRVSAHLRLEPPPLRTRLGVPGAGEHVRWSSAVVERGVLGRAGSGQQP